VTAGLVGAREQAEVDHDCAIVVGRGDVVAAERERLVVAEERGINLLVELDTVGLDLDCVKGVDDSGADELVLLLDRL